MDSVVEVALVVHGRGVVTAIAVKVQDRLEPVLNVVGTVGQSSDHITLGDVDLGVKANRRQERRRGHSSVGAGDGGGTHAGENSGADDEGGGKGRHVEDVFLLVLEV